MLTITISLLFALAALAALATLSSSVIAGSRRIRAILAELAKIERAKPVTRVRPALSMPRAMLQPAFAAA